MTFPTSCDLGRHDSRSGGPSRLFPTPHIKRDLIGCGEANITQKEIPNCALIIKLYHIALYPANENIVPKSYMLVVNCNVISSVRKYISDYDYFQEKVRVCLISTTMFIVI